VKLLYSAASPYARKVLVVAHETGRIGEIEAILQATGVLDPPADLMRFNPLAKIPTLILEEGTTLYDSRVICEFLDAGATRRRVFPQGEARWPALVQQALADGVLDAALLLRTEVTVRPEQYRFDRWQDGQTIKIRSALDRLEETVAALSEVTIGSIATACALGYLDLRFGDLAWRGGRPALEDWYAGFARRPSMVATAPAG